jgi:sugar transferase EpsL
VKRLMDIVSAGVGLIFLSPLLLLIAIFVWFQFGSPIFFRQLRPGLHGKPFTILKFRTMKDQRDKAGNLMPDDQRLTNFGRLLRASSLDELPELWNVLRGDMSLVGPRPLLMEYLRLYTPDQMRRNNMRPGITGWAQVNGRNAITWEEKFGLDVWYVENQSIWLDIKILFITLRKVLQREGISAAGDATMPAFTGTRFENEK